MNRLLLPKSEVLLQPGHCWFESSAYFIMLVYLVILSVAVNAMDGINSGIWFHFFTLSSVVCILNPHVRFIDSSVDAQSCVIQRWRDYLEFGQFFQSNWQISNMEVKLFSWHYFQKSPGIDRFLVFYNIAICLYNQKVWRVSNEPIIQFSCSLYAFI